MIGVRGKGRGSLNILEVEGLTKKYDTFTAVKKIDFTVAEGEIFGFLGPNGAGKTTTINMLCGLASITGGTARLGGLDYRRNLPAIKGKIGIVPDESNLYEELDGFDNLSFCASLYGLDKQERGGKGCPAVGTVRAERRGTETLQALFQGDEA